MICKQCGSEVDAGKSFCGQCGAPVAPAQEAKEPKKPASKALRTGFWIAIAVAMAAVALLVVFLVLHAEDENALGMAQLEPVGNAIYFGPSEELAETAQVTVVLGQTRSSGEPTIAVDMLMEAPADVVIEQRDENGDVIASEVVPGLMVIDVPLQGDVDMDKYEDAQTLFVSDPAGEFDMDDIADLQNVTVLYLVECSGLEDLDDFKDMESLEALWVEKSPVNDIGALVDLEALRTLALRRLGRELDIEVLGSMDGLQALALELPFAGDIDAVKTMDGLKKLELVSMDTGIDAVQHLDGLEALSLDDLSGVDTLDALVELQNLKTLRMFSLDVQSIDVLKELDALENVTWANLSIDEKEVSDAADALRGRGASVKTGE